MLRILIWLCLGASSTLYAAETFEEFEIRVIRPRYFVKRGKMEIGVQGFAVLNQPFIYNYLGSVMGVFHVSEHWGLAGEYSQGSTLDKEDKQILSEDFDVKTQIIRTERMGIGFLEWTPAYGKYQIGSGSLLYFDSFVLAGGGVVGSRFAYDQCGAALSSSKSPEQYFYYPSAELGMGQRFYINQSSSLKWDLRSTLFEADLADASCTDQAPSDTALQINISMHFGYTYFI